MMRWHMIDKATGKIIRTVAASSKAEATQLLGRGMIVSAASWKLDVHKFKPVVTVVTDITQDQQERKVVVYFYKKGYRTAQEISRDFDARVNQVRHIIERYNISCVRKVFGGRTVRFFSPASCRRIKTILDKMNPQVAPRRAVLRSYALHQSNKEK